MNKKSASIFLGFALDLVFGFLFLLLITQWISDCEEITLHMNQVGIFKEEKNSILCIKKVNDLGLQAYSYKKDDLILVVTSLYVNEKDTIEEQKILSKGKMSYLLKEVTSSSQEFVKSVQNNDMEKIMELMSD